MRHKVKHVHFVGIGGSGMSGIAEVLLNLKYKISGSDLAENAATQRLKDLGATIFHRHAASNIKTADVVVISTAVTQDNPEVIAAREHQIPVVPRAMMLAELMRLRQGIAVAGTHGKTTTTSLIASVLAQGGMDPTFVIGGRLTSAGTHAKLGTGEFLVAEADESDASFLYLQPVLAVVTNIDADHMETYEHDFEKLKQAFVYFLQHLPFYGIAVLCVDDAHVRDIIPLAGKPVLTYGLSEDAQVRAVEVQHCAGSMRFKVTRKLGQRKSPEYKDLDIQLNLAGLHNVQNALAAIAVGTEVGVADEHITAALAEFKGVGRRFQRYGEIAWAEGGTFILIDDYAHHPVEMSAALAAVRGAFPGRRLSLAFQPHRYTRTRDLFEDFVKVLQGVDHLWLTEIYPAGEAPIVAADGRALARAVRVAGKVEPVFVENISELPQAILNSVAEGDVVVTMGAGSIGQVPMKLVELTK